jgi:fatty acid desaturase
VDTAPAETAAADYRRLVDEVRGAGLLERRPGYYSAKIGLTFGGFAAGWLALLVVGDSWAALGVAVFLGLMCTQVVFVGHDAGHHQIFRSRRANRVVGLAVGNAMTGLSFGWWVPKHNAHHAYPNQEGRDPDVGAGALAFTDAAARGRRHGLTRLLTRWQAWLFFPLLLLEGAALQVTSIVTVLRRRDRGAVLEGVLLAVHGAAYLGAVAWVLSPVRALVFVGVQQGLFGLYLGCTFAPNHKGMEMLGHDSKMGFARRQVVTARNVTGGRTMTFLLGGLNYQIEHHLFPAMPRPNLRRAQGIVRRFCAEQHLDYVEDSLTGSYRQALRHLASVGRSAGAGAVPAVPDEVRRAA